MINTSDMQQEKEKNQQFHEIVVEKDGFAVYYGDAPLKTERNNPIYHGNQRLINNLLFELSLSKPAEPGRINLYTLIAAEIDYPDQNTEQSIELCRQKINHDPIINLFKNGSRPSSARSASAFTNFLLSHPAFLAIAYSSSATLTRCLSYYLKQRKYEEQTGNTDNFTDLGHFLLQAHHALPPEKKNALHILSEIHDSGFILPLLATERMITASEYAGALINQRLTQSFGSSHTQAARNDLEMYQLLKTMEKLEQDVRKVHDYLAYYDYSQKGPSGILDLIRQGESNALEFKSTLRWNLREQKKDPAIEHASLKTITAFLNSSGGVLLIGVKDNGDIEGIETDAFENTDRFLIHLWNLIKSTLGQEFSPYILTTTEVINNKTICIVRCMKSHTPAFLTHKGPEEEFYIRIGPQTAKLGVSEALKYIKERFPA